MKKVLLAAVCAAVSMGCVPFDWQTGTCPDGYRPWTDPQAGVVCVDAQAFP